MKHIEVLFADEEGWTPKRMESYWKDVQLEEGLTILKGTWQVWVEYRKPWIHPRFAENVVSFDVQPRKRRIVFHRKYREGFVVLCPYRARNIAKLVFRPQHETEEHLQYH